MDQQMLETGLKMSLALAAVLLTFGAAVFVAKRFAGSSKGFLKRGTRGQIKPLEILAHQNLGPGRAMYLVRCINKKVLIGATNANIHHLADIFDTDEQEEEATFSRSLSEELNTDKDLHNKFNGNLREIQRV